MRTEKLLSIALLSITALGMTGCEKNVEESHSGYYHNIGLENNSVIRMLLKKGLPTNNISVCAYGHTLQVIGFLDNAEQFKNLVEVLKAYREHDRVINNVKILSKHDVKRDEKHLRKAILERLSEVKLSADDIIVEVRNGHVITGGFINKHVGANLVREAVRTVPGVTTIDNYVLYKS